MTVSFFHLTFFPNKTTYFIPSTCSRVFASPIPLCFFLCIQRISNDSRPLPPTLAESRSQGWSDADHMPSLSIKVLTLHSACLLSQGFPLRLKISLASFFCLLQDPHIEFFQAMLFSVDSYRDANQVLPTVAVMERLSRPRAHRSAVMVWRRLELITEDCLGPRALA